METIHSSTSSFKKIGLFVLKLFLSCILLGYLISQVFEKYIILQSEITGASKVHRIIHTVNKEEIPILGSSRAQGSFVPSILGDHYYNYGIDGAQARVWLFFLEEELNKQSKNTPIIINFDLEGFRQSYGDIANYIPNYQYSPVRSIIEEKASFHYRIPFIKYFGHYEGYFKSFINQKVNITKHIDHGGSFEKNVLTPERFNDLVVKRKATEGYFKYDETLENRFHQLISSTDRSIYLIIPPYHTSFFEKYQNLDEAQDYLKNLANADNVKVLDFSHAYYPDSLFMNTTHLNYQGARQFSDTLKTYFSIVP